MKRTRSCAAFPEDRANHDLHVAFEILAKKKKIASANRMVHGRRLRARCRTRGSYARRRRRRLPTLGNRPRSAGKIHAPILGIFGAEDRGITPTDVRKFGEALDQMGRNRNQDLRRRRRALRKSQPQARSRSRCSGCLEAHGRLLETTLKSNAYVRGDLKRGPAIKSRASSSSRHK